MASVTRSSSTRTKPSRCSTSCARGSRCRSCRRSTASTCSAMSTFDRPAKAKRAAELDQELAQPGVWDDPRQASQMAREASENRELVATWDRLERRARDVVELDQLADGDPDLRKQVAAELAEIGSELRAHELDLLFTDPYAGH